ncbi:hypothetical protein M5K25_025979 [Dendrobium thyrsiflorum]|uniref:Transposase n=1 Tax=Dendrobium thyrsiflorum TaxID=117978 RepID=A0ABD0TW77_DENTH
MTEGRMLIEPDGDTFHPSKQPTHKIRDIIRSRFNAPYISWKKVPKEVRDMWFKEFEKNFCWLPQHNDKIRKNFEKCGSTRMRDMFTDIRKSGERPLWIGESVWAELTGAWDSPDYTRRRDQNRQNRASDVRGMGSSLHTGGSVPHTEHRRRLDEYTRIRESQAGAGEGSFGGSAEYSDYRIWSQAVGGMQYGRVYGLGSQAYAYEGQTSGGSSFLASTQKSLYSTQVDALQAELEQVRKSQSDWQIQMQIQMQVQMKMQQTQLLDELQKMREHLSGKQVSGGLSAGKSYTTKRYHISDEIFPSVIPAYNLLIVPSDEGKASEEGRTTEASVQALLQLEAGSSSNRGRSSMVESSAERAERKLEECCDMVPGIELSQLNPSSEPKRRPCYGWISEDED